MVRYVFLFLVAFWATGSARADTWADSLFDEQSHDFGSVPRGGTIAHPFRIKNNTNSHVHIAGVRVSCGCGSAAVVKADLAPGEDSALWAYMDTQRFTGMKTITIFVQFDRPQWDEVHLLIHANCRDDFSIAPATFAMGRVKKGASPASAVTITFQGDGATRILDARSDSNYVQPEIQEVRQTNGDMTYQLTARVRPELPVGKWFTDIWVRTNNGSIPRLRVPLTIEIEPALDIAPRLVDLGEVKIGTEKERGVIIRGGQPFRIVEIRGMDDHLTVADTSTENKPVHVLNVTLKAASPGDWTRRLQVITDLKDENEIEFQARAHITP